MIIETAFVFTAGVVLSTSAKIIGAMIGNDVNIPSLIPMTPLAPSYWAVWYPSLFFQVWFWADKLAVI